MKDWLKVEAVLFGSGKYLTEDELVNLSGVPKKSIKRALSELKKHYADMESSLDIFNESDAWKLNVREDFAGIVKNVISEAEMPKAIMETLALIAYKSPVLQSEIIDSRGTGAYEHIALLEDKGFISREKSGRSFKLKTAPKFFDYFDVEGDSKLRQLFKDVKKPETVGNLEVYTTKNEEEKEAEFSGQLLERMQKVEETPSDHEEKKKFLDNFDDKFSKAKTAIDETDSEMNEFRRVEQHTPLEWENKEDSAKAEEQNSDEPEDVLKKFDDEMVKFDEVASQLEKERTEGSEEESEEISSDAEEKGLDESEESEKESEKESEDEEEPAKPVVRVSAKKEKKTEEKKEIKKEEKRRSEASSISNKSEKKETEHDKHKEDQHKENKKNKEKEIQNNNSKLKKK